MGGIAWTEEEDNLLKKCIRQYGEGKWHRVPLLAGRTANDVKNYWNCHLSKKLNAQETEQNNKNDGNMVNVTRPQPRNIEKSCSRRPCFKPPEDAGSTSTPVPCIEQSQIYLEDNGYHTWNEEYGAVGGFSTNIQFEQVREEDETNGKWDLDDFILDLDLWNDSF
ncbi:hypothetical protein FEM48_Zijuj02G0178900 [Ziziphus jujuba var. spinosa]|uniref:Uncharacterized protein n=1 Tax=Ziziphus jujuba var. spinosa TaxID=714518 RepID=A0A978VX44_ZIZJJ|nr:hypothetical protein FEM48_Zijuj02G0178900 [Ziziphus jujuba var. spinosa]